MKQDHINENIQGYQNNVTVLADWLAAQAQASYDNGIPIMYCMDQPWCAHTHACVASRRIASHHTGS